MLFTKGSSDVKMSMKCDTLCLQVKENDAAQVFQKYKSKKM